MRIDRLLTGLIVIAAVGCGTADSTAPTAKGTAGATVGQAGPTAATPAAAMPTPPVIEGNEHSFGDYTFRLPTRFEQAEMPAGGPPNMQNAVWRAMLDESNPASVFMTVSIQDAKEVAKSTSNMRQTLVNFSAGATDRMGIKIAQRGPTQKIDANGLNVSYFVWSGLLQESPVDGAAYGFVDGERVFCMLHIGWDENAKQNTAEVTKSIASWKKK